MPTRCRRSSGRWRSPPTGRTGSPRSAGQVLAAGVTGAHSLNQQKIASWLHAHSVQTVVGQVAFTADGENRLAVKSAAVFQWQPGPGGTGANFIQVLPSGVGTKAPISWAG